MFKQQKIQKQFQNAPIQVFNVKAATIENASNKDFGFGFKPSIDDFRAVMKLIPNSNYPLEQKVDENAQAYLDRAYSLGNYHPEQLKIFHNNTQLYENSEERIGILNSWADMLASAVREKYNAGDYNQYGGNKDGTGRPDDYGHGFDEDLDVTNKSIYIALSIITIAKENNVTRYNNPSYTSLVSATEQDERFFNAVAKKFGIDNFNDASEYDRAKVLWHIGLAESLMEQEIVHYREGKLAMAAPEITGIDDKEMLVIDEFRALLEKDDAIGWSRTGSIMGQIKQDYATNRAGDIQKDFKKLDELMKENEDKKELKNLKAEYNYMGNHSPEYDLTMDELELLHQAIKKADVGRVP